MGRAAGFVNLEEEAEVVSYDPQALTVKGKYSITGCKTPTGLAIDAANSRLFIGCRSKVMAVMNAGYRQSNHHSANWNACRRGRLRCGQ